MQLFNDPNAWQMPLTLLMVGGFAWLEQSRPIVKINWRRELSLDIAGLVAVTASSGLALWVLRAIFTSASVRTAFTFLNPLAVWPVWVRLPLALVFVDFGLYWAHRLMHHRWFWRTHEWHHSVTDMYWLSGYRASLTHTFLYFTPPAMAYFLIFKLSPWELVAMGAVGTGIQIFVHSNWNAQLGWLGKIVVTPLTHRLHHDRDEIYDKNFGTVLTIWDRLFGTFVDPALYPEPRPLGLSGPTPSATRMMVGV
ncbi:MAG: sterol desaturase family protein [Bdellovibrionales bacterium]|nr:sterol desaturase family protein [Bdellovibrionales bacterium]